MRRFIPYAVLLLVRLVSYWVYPLCSEDAYISLHAALDPAWRVAATSPVWSVLTFGSPEIARFWCLLADMAMLYAASRALSKRGLWAFTAFLCMPFMVGSSVSGLETHVVAAAMVVGLVSPWGYAVAAALRPDAAVLVLCASGKRWRYALGGAVVMVWAGILFSGHPIPQTITSKALTYGIHPGNWNWLHPKEFGWLSVALLSALMSGPFLYVAAACAFLLTHVVLGTVSFWWYPVPALTMLALSACRRIWKPWELTLALSLMACFWPYQQGILQTRLEQEGRLWNTGLVMKSKPNMTGTVLLEPAGMIPYLNRQLNVVDDVGLLDPWMAERRAKGRGWRTDAIARYHPRWIVLRLREFAFPGTWDDGSAYYNLAEAKPKGYACVYAPDITIVGKIAKFKLVSSNLVVLKRIIP